MPTEPKRETKAIEYVVGGLCVWHVLMGVVGGVLQGLGLDGGGWWRASVIALCITVCALLKIHRDESQPLRSLPTVDPLAQLLTQSAPTDELSSKTRTEPKRKVSARDYFAGVFSVWILAMAINAIVAGSVAWASLIALGITSSAVLTIHKRASQPLRSLPTVGPLAQLIAQEKRDRNVS